MCETHCIPYVAAAGAMCMYACERTYVCVCNGLQYRCSVYAPCTLHAIAAAGDADECHPCIGYARRLMVPRREQQADILLQAVQNHNPDVIIVDEIGTWKVGHIPAS